MTDTARRVRDSVGTRDWIVGVVGAVLVAGFSFWLTTVAGDLTDINHKLDETLQRLVRIETKAERNEKDIEKMQVGP